MRAFRTSIAIVGFVVLALCNTATAQEKPSFTTGLAQTINPGLKICGENRARVSAVGKIKAEDGTEWTVPAVTNFVNADKASDLFNQCGGVQLHSITKLDLDSVPVMNAGGKETFTAYIFADNYFEFYVNGRLLAVDAVPFTPFNSSVIRFKADRPFTTAVMGVDWEENLGLGSERNRGVDYHPGDAGFVAVIKDAAGETVALTDASWKGQTFYTAPLQSRDCLIVNGAIRDSSKCAETSVKDGRSFSAAHWAIPENWAAANFDDSDWPQAKIYTNDTVGVDNKPAYTNFTELFDDPKADAEFIWSSNLVLDNLVLLRKTVE